eukprot:1162029-Pelagomonas_calceolata.AAC.6
MCVNDARRYAPINPGDTYSAKTGGTYGSDTTAIPYVGGHDGVGVVAKAERALPTSIKGKGRVGSKEPCISSTTKQQENRLVEI